MPAARAKLARLLGITMEKTTSDGDAPNMVLPMEVSSRSPRLSGALNRADKVQLLVGLNRFNPLLMAAVASAIHEGGSIPGGADRAETMMMIQMTVM